VRERGVLNPQTEGVDWKKGKGDCFGCERERERERESGGLGFLWRPEAFVSASGGRRPRGGFWRRSRRLLRRQRRRRGVSSTEFKDVGYHSRFSECDFRNPAVRQ
jgi:hypothetical protein